MVREAQEKIKKKEQTQLDVKFEALMAKPFATPKIPEIEIQKYAQIAQMKTRPDWKAVLKKILEAPKVEDKTIDFYAKTAITAQTPVPLLKRHENDLTQIVKEMVATKVPGMPQMKESAVIAAITLASGLERRDISFRKWAETQVSA